jgi:hypothetical protein
MANDKTINLTFDLGEVTNDILAKCNLISQSVKDEALADIRANVMEPDNPETRSIICRAVTEAFGKVKVACNRWLKVGRTKDTNALERLVASTTTDGTTTKEVFEKIELTLVIPNFNTAVTDHLKSSIHKYVVDWCMYRFLQDQIADKASEYKKLADSEDYSNIVQDLNRRENFNMRRASWI